MSSVYYKSHSNRAHFIKRFVTDLILPTFGLAIASVWREDRPAADALGALCPPRIDEAVANLYETQTETTAAAAAATGEVSTAGPTDWPTAVRVREQRWYVSQEEPCGMT